MKVEEKEEMEKSC